MGKGKVSIFKNAVQALAEITVFLKKKKRHKQPKKW